MFLPRHTGVLLLIAACSSTSIAYAQGGTERDRARTAADEGAQAFEAGRYAEAISSFERAEGMVHAPPHLLYIARSQAKLGQLLKARDTYRRIVRENLPPSAPPPFRQAQAEASGELKDLGNRIPELKILVSGAEDEAANVAIDGERLASSLVGKPIAIDPGDHTVSARVRGVAQSKRVFLSEGATENVVLDFGGSSRAKSQRSGSSPGLVAGAVTSFVIGAAGIGGGVYFAMRSDRKHDEAQSLCEAGCPVSRKDEIDGLYSDSKRYQNLAGVSFAIGGVGLVTGTTLLIINGSSSDKEQKTAGVRPFVGVGSAGMRGRF